MLSHSITRDFFVSGNVQNANLRGPSRFAGAHEVVYLYQG